MSTTSETNGRKRHCHRIVRAIMLSTAVMVFSAANVLAQTEINGNPDIKAATEKLNKKIGKKGEIAITVDDKKTLCFTGENKAGWEVGTCFQLYDNVEIIQRLAVAVVPAADWTKVGDASAVFAKIKELNEKNKLFTKEELDEVADAGPHKLENMLTRMLAYKYAEAEAKNAKLPFPVLKMSLQSETGDAPNFGRYGLFSGNSISTTGAAGIGQFESPAWNDYKGRLNLDNPNLHNPFDPVQAIKAKVKYLADLYHQNYKRLKGTDMDGMALNNAAAVLAIMSYNAGAGTVRKYMTVEHNNEGLTVNVSAGASAARIQQIQTLLNRMRDEGPHVGIHLASFTIAANTEPKATAQPNS